MKFTALPVNVGDSFLLEIDDLKVLVDGGMNQKHIVKLLNQKRIKNNHINILICTHYDADHINGIIGLLKSKYSFDELWLPEIYGSLAKSASVLINSVNLNQLFNERVAIPPNEIFYEYIKSDSVKVENDDSFETIDVNLLDEINNELTCFYPYRSFLEIFPSNLKLINNIKRINKLVKYSLKSGAYVRWFKYTGNLENNVITKNMTAKNSIQTSISVYDPTKFLEMLSLTTINKESLVFCYENGSNPNVLFSADSDLSFIKTTQKLNDNSIVTAPHHGSDENNRAYSKISGNNLIFIRSDRSQLKRPGSEYKKLKDKYCTICQNNGPKKEVTIEYTSSRIIKPIDKCICK